MNAVSEELCTYSSLAIEDGNVWYVTYRDNYLMSVDIQSGITSFYGRIPGTEGIVGAYRKLLFIHGCIYLLPFKGLNICRYTIQSGRFELIRFTDKINHILGEQGRFFGGFVYKNEIVMYGILPVIVRYRYDSDTFVFYDIGNGKTGFQTDMLWFWNSGYAIDDKICIPLSSYKAIVQIDANTNAFNIIKWGDTAEPLVMSFVMPYEDKIICAGLDKEWNIRVEAAVWESNMKFHTIADFSVSGGGSNTDHESPFFEGKICGDCLILIPAYQNEFYSINLNTGEIKKKNCFSPEEKEFEQNGIMNCYGGEILTNGFLGTILSRKSAFLQINPKELSIQKKKMTLSKKTKLELSKQYASELENKCIVYEQRSVFDLESLLDYVQHKG